MGWYIHEIDNTVDISPKVAKALFKAQQYEGELWDEPEDVAYKDKEQSKLSFNTDHMEHMDYLWSNYDILKVLCKHKVKGRITFCSYEGDNAGQYWGHEFDGKGGYTRLVGQPATIKYVPDENQPTL